VLFRVLLAVLGLAEVAHSLARVGRRCKYFLKDANGIFWVRIAGGEGAEAGEGHRLSAVVAKGGLVVAADDGEDVEDAGRSSWRRLGEFRWDQKGAQKGVVGAKGKEMDEIAALWQEAEEHIRAFCRFRLGVAGPDGTGRYGKNSPENLMSTDDPWDRRRSRMAGEFPATVAWSRKEKVSISGG